MEIPSPARINAANQQFWHQEQQQMEAYLQDEAIVDTAVEALAAEQKKTMLPKDYSSFEMLLADAAKIAKRFYRQMARKGGKSPKSDTLQKLIEAKVSGHPKISAAELLNYLKEIERIPQILEIDAQDIRFTNFNGKEKLAPLSGLKDRLHSAKEKTQSR